MTTSFTSKWLKKPGETLRYEGAKSAKRVGSTPRVDTVQVLTRLVDGSRWLTAQHAAWLIDDSSAADDTEFYHALDGWERLEEQLRDSGYRDCIYGQGEHCPKSAIADCAACIGVATSPAQQSGFAA